MQVDYIGVAGDQLAFYATSSADTALKTLSIPSSLLRAHPDLSMRTNLQVRDGGGSSC